MKRIFTLIAVAIVVATVPVVAQKTKRTNEAISRASELMQNARYEEADKIIDSLLAINSNYSDALYLRSNALLKNDKYEEALDYLPGDMIEVLNKFSDAVNGQYAYKVQIRTWCYSMARNSPNQGVKANNAYKEHSRLEGRVARYHRANGVALQENYCGAKGIACLNAKDAWQTLWR